MVVDDDEICRLYFRDLFEREGYEVNICHDGVQAVQSFNMKRPDAVLMDIRMPILDGNETLKQLKAIDSDVPIIMMTAYSSLEVALECGQLGAENIIKKPGDIEKVVEVIENAIEKSRNKDIQKPANDE